MLYIIESERLLRKDRLSCHSKIIICLLLRTYIPIFICKSWNFYVSQVIPEIYIVALRN